MMKKAFLVQVLGAWGRGPTLPEAAAACFEAGASKNDATVIDLVIGDDAPAITNSGMNISYLEGSEVIRVGKGLRLHQLLRVQV